jgi:hypothetical protein
VVLSVRATAPEADHLTLQSEFRELWAKAHTRLTPPEAP